MHHRSAVLLALVLASCTPARERGAPPSAGAGVAPFLAGRVPLSARAEGGFELPQADVQLAVGLRAREGVQVSTAGVRFTIASDELGDVAGTMTDGVVTYRAARPDEDTIVVGAPNGFEELRVVRSAGSEFVAHERITFQQGRLAVRVRDRRVELLEPSGHLAFGSAPPFLVDARGTKRDVDVEIEARADGAMLTFRADVSDLVRPLVIDPAWSTVGAMSVGRQAPSAVTLNDGRVFVAGGTSDPSTGAQLSTAELYDPTSNMWSSAGAMPSGARPNLLLLPSGKVLVFTRASGRPAEPAATFDPADKSWTLHTAGPTFGFFAMPVWSTAVAKAIIVDREEVHLYDEATHTWTRGTSMAQRRQDYGIGALADGRVMVIGGKDVTERVLADAQIYDPTANAWSDAGRVSAPRRFANVRVSSGKIFAIGGNNASQYGVSVVEIFDPGNKSWSLGPPAPQELSGSGLVRLAADRLLSVEANSVAVFDTLTLRWARANRLSPTRPEHATAPISMGRVLAAGGVIGNVASAIVDVYTPLANGAACDTTYPGDCGTGWCAGGVCCDNGCDGACERCDAAGSVGQCTSVTGTPKVTSACAPYASCVAGTCAANCATTADCATGSYCLATQCVARKPAGSACVDTAECLTGICADGVCCKTACSGQCEACDLSGDGTCSAVAGKPRGLRAACSGEGDECGTVCDGTVRTQCNYLPAGTVPCGRNACSGGTETHAATCDGAGSCADVAKGCGTYKCGDVACKSACGSKADCSDGNFCSGGACVPVPGLGSPCTDASVCESGACVDGVCCGSPSCGPGRTCAAPGKLGRCTQLAGIACSTTEECATGVCTEGVCCDKPCAGQCESCTVPGQLGTCRAVIGQPRGGKARCALDAAAPCASRLCDGKEPVLCAGFVGPDVTCHAAACKDGEATAAVTCTGDGTCAAPQKTPCGAYACDGAGEACRLVCSADAECAPTFRCVAGACKPGGNACDEAKTTVLFTDGSSRACLPYRCEGGTCIAKCANTDDCAAGYLCDGAACVAAAPAPQEESGCSTIPGARGTGGFVLPFMVAAFALSRRRRLALVAAGAVAVACSPQRDERAETARTRSAVWTANGETNDYHLGGFIFRLPSGDVIVWENTLLMDKWSASTGAWTKINETYLNHTYGAGVEIAPGKFLMAGADSPDRATVKLFDAEAVIVTPKASLLTPRRYRPLGVYLSAPVSRVLITGGQGGDPDAYITASELYDATANTWTATTALSRDHLDGTIVPLSNGRAVVFGGRPATGSTKSATVDLYDGVAKTWTAMAPMSVARAEAHAFVLSTGKVLVFGGGSALAELFDPAANTWTPAGTSITAERSAAASLGLDRFVVAGGSILPNGVDTAVWSPTKLSFLPASPLLHDRTQGRAVGIGTGKALLVGGTSAQDGYMYTSEIFQLRANGLACKGAGDCESEACVDGVCCNTACLGACQACNLAGSVGTCSDVTGAPATGHPTCAPYKACVAGACDPACTTDAECCAAGECTTSYAGAYCNGSACVPKKAKGASCVLSKECLTGQCVDGACCDSACGGQCEACNVSGSVGTCSAVSGAPAGSRPACTGVGIGTECGPRCNGVARAGCTFAPATTTCGADACTSGVETHTRTCDGVGRCGDVPKACGAYACGGSTCKTACTTNTECTPGFVCNAPLCVPAPGLGQPCSASAPCSGGLFCTDGACCGVASCGAGKSCGLTARRGECAKLDAQTCTSDGECGSGACVDGVCCDGPCTGQCQACDVEGNIGKCVAVKGAPHGSVRVACPSNPDDACESATCDGSDGIRCAALPGAETACRAARCASGVLASAGTCDGSGACSAGTKTPCAPFACAASGDACATACATGDQCAAGFVCAAGSCVKPFGRCSEDRTAILDVDGKESSCAPLLCKDGACLDACASSDDCVSGTVCLEGKCVPPTSAVPPSEDASGCSTSRTTSSGAFAALVVLALAGRLARRRSAAV